MGVNFTKEFLEEWEKISDSIKFQMASRGIRAANELRTASQEKVLRGQRSGRVYKVPGTHGKRLSKATKSMLADYGRRFSGGTLYRASAPGEPPAARTGTFRTSWQPKSTIEHNGGYTVVSTVESTVRTDNGKYLLGEILENGTPGGKIAPRPHQEKIQQEALPKIMRIYNEPYV